MTEPDQPRPYTARPYAARRALLDRALQVHGYICSICAGPISPGDESLQHIIPRSAGGTDDEANLRPAHKRCNSALGNRSLDPSLVVYGGEVLLLELLGHS